MIKKKPVSVKGLVFDMDGLLLDSEKVVKRSWDYAGKELGYENFGDHIYNTVGFNLKRRTEYFKTNVDLDFPMDRFAQMTREYYYKIADKEGIAVKKGAPELLNAAKSHGCMIGLATSSRQIHAEQSLKRAGLYDYFDGKVFGDTVKEGKPSPEIYLKACKSIGIEPEDAVALEDAPSGAISAHAAGMTETVQAEELTVDSKVAQIQGESIIPRADQVPGNEELFAQYVEQTFYGEESESYRTPAVYGNIGQNVLTGADKYVYNELKKIAANIADGKAADGSEPSGQYVSTKFTLSVAGQGITYEGGAFKGFSLSKVIAALLADCPYDLYWYNKTASTWFNGRISGREVVEIDINFPAADAYAGPEIEQQYKTKCTVDSKKTGAASSAAENARKIIEKHKAEKDYEKMESYKEEICDLTSYNYDAVKPGVAYGDPWQMIYVFDGDESTNVVCEGYAKAFQYLCDMSDFLDPGYNCCSVTGMMRGGTGEGPHMWNIVTIGDGNYLVDVTNSDDGTAGERGGLFMAWDKNNGSVENGYVFNTVYYDDAITFAYDGRTKDLYGTGDNSVLKIASAEYEEPKGTAPVIEGVENGGNYYATQKITVRDADNDLASVTVNGKQEAGTEISLSADNQNNQKKEYTIIAEDRRGNSTSCKITINPCSDLQKRISHLSVDTVKVTDKALVQNTLKDAVTAVENAAEEEKTILAEVKTKCETLLAKIDEMTQPQDYIRGDVDANSKVDVGDVRTALRYICKKTNLTETQMKAGDVTGDEKVTIEDLRKILRYVCKKITEL